MRGADGFYMPPPKMQSDEGNDNSSPASEDTSWRLIPTEDLIHNIDGMGEKKLKAITEQFPNLGTLEDARGEASKACKSFKEVLPKGVGERMANAIEDAIINATPLPHIGDQPEDCEN